MAVELTPPRAENSTINGAARMAVELTPLRAENSTINGAARMAVELTPRRQRARALCACPSAIGDLAYAPDLGTPCPQPATRAAPSIAAMALIIALSAASDARGPVDGCNGAHYRPVRSHRRARPRRWLQTRSRSAHVHACMRGTAAAGWTPAAGRRDPVARGRKRASRRRRPRPRRALALAPRLAGPGTALTCPECPCTPPRYPDCRSPGGRR